MISSYAIEEFLDKYVPYQILKRGKQIFQEGRVEIVEVDEDSAFVCVNVGSQSNPRTSYEVELFDLDDLNEIYSSCTCPYDRETCKHAVAALLLVLAEFADWEEEPAIDISETQQTSPPKGNSQGFVTKSISVEDPLPMNQVAARTDFVHSNPYWWQREAEVLDMEHRGPGLKGTVLGKDGLFNPSVHLGEKNKLSCTCDCGNSLSCTGANPFASIFISY